jgi:hypothetical protein
MKIAKVYLNTNETFDIEILDSTTVIDICAILDNNVFFYDDDTCVACDSVVAFEIEG